MQTNINHHVRSAVRVLERRLFMKLAAVIATVFLLSMSSRAQTDPRSMMGGGNFPNGGGDVSNNAVDQYNALNTLGAKMSRMNIYPDHYWNGSAATPSAVQSAVLQAHRFNVTPMILFEYYSNLGTLGDYNKWFAIGR